jgi:deoxyribonuclease-4
MARWDDVIGGQAIRAFHLNDSKKPFDSRRDRHEHIGLGEVGVTGFHALLHDPRFKGVPKVLETPKRDDGHEDRANLNVLRKLLGAKRPPGRRPSWKTPEKIDKAWADRLKRGM